MKIIADSNILFVREAFSPFGEIDVYTTRVEDRNKFEDAEVLLCRSTMKINRDLLGGTKVKFVATATSGTEHFDTLFLRDNNIEYFDAKGSNSNSVSEYVIAALLKLANKNGIILEGKTLGIVGFGNVGSKVARKSEALGLKVLMNDPPLKRKLNDEKFMTLDDLMDCDIISLHVPMICEGEYRTYHLFDDERLSKMKKGSILINTSRGSVVSETALQKHISNKHISHTIFDVWENEPNINSNIIDSIDISTPHIAGHSYDGKVLGTYMIFKEFCKYFNLDASWDYEKLLPVVQKPIIEIESTDYSDQEYFSHIIEQIYNITNDGNKFRKIMALKNSEKSKYFDRLRKEYPVRREFSNFTVDCKNHEDIKNRIKILGFSVQ